MDNNNRFNYDARTRFPGNQRINGPANDNFYYKNPGVPHYMPTTDYFFPSPARKSNKNYNKKSPYSKRKTCSCVNSQCLKLYCRCFASGEFCVDCNCKGCHNTFSSIERSRAIKSSLEKNPNAFHSKIGVGKKKGNTERVHTAGCHCRKSSCMKNYCECYEAKVACSDRCKCCDCRNTEYDRESLMCDKFPMIKNEWDKSSSYSIEEEDVEECPKTPIVFPWIFITDAVIEAASTCLLTRAFHCEKNEASEIETINGLCDEFGNAFCQIFDAAKQLESSFGIIKNEINDDDE